MSNSEISAFLEYDTDEFKNAVKTDKKLKQALEKGKAMAVQECSQTVLKAIRGELTETRKITGIGKKPDTSVTVVTRRQELQVKAALEFLDRHGENWRKEK